MAQITWRNVQGPSFGAANNLLAGATNQVGSGLDALADVAGQSAETELLNFQNQRKNEQQQFENNLATDNAARLDRRLTADISNIEADNALQLKNYALDAQKQGQETTVFNQGQKTRTDRLALGAQFKDYLRNNPEYDAQDAYGYLQGLGIGTAEDVATVFQQQQPLVQSLSQLDSADNQLFTEVQAANTQEQAEAQTALQQRKGLVLNKYGLTTSDVQEFSSPSQRTKEDVVGGFVQDISSKTKTPVDDSELLETADAINNYWIDNFQTPAPGHVIEKAIGAAGLDKTFLSNLRDGDEFSVNKNTALKAAKGLADKYNAYNQYQTSGDAANLIEAENNLQTLNRQNSNNLENFKKTLGNRQLREAFGETSDRPAFEGGGLYDQFISGQKEARINFADIQQQLKKDQETQRKTTRQNAKTLSDKFNQGFNAR